MPKSAATCEIGRPLSSASRTPRSSNSSGYFLGLDMTAENLLSPGQHPGSEVPAKPGPAQSVAKQPSTKPPGFANPRSAAKAAKNAGVPRLALTKAEAAASLGVSVDFLEEHVQ